ncbi:MAG: NlpC/P60 family protein [Nocardioidaceae bacterium]
MIDGRLRVATALATASIVALGGAVLVASPSSAEPSITDVRAKVDNLYRQAEEASERYNDAHDDLVDARRRLSGLQSDLADQQGKFDQVRDRVAGVLVAQYQGQGLSRTSQVLFSDDPDQFLSELQTVSAYNAREAGVLQEYTVAAKQLALRQQAAQRETDAISATEQRLADEKATIDKKAAEAKALLDKLETAERERLLAASRGGERIPLSDVPAEGRAKVAVKYALAQVGKAYVYGAAGPSAFDCSGLTMRAWGQAGVGLPHSSSAQRGYGRPVASNALQPGDLVFYYSPISHVAMYIGNGMIVHAANPGEGVRVSPVFSMPYSGAVRPG